MTDPATCSVRHLLFILILGLCGAITAVAAEAPAPSFHVVAFYSDDLGDKGRTLSSTLASATQNRLIRQLLYWVAGHEPPRR